MVVYEATEREHYKKIAEFLNSQPKASVWLNCFTRGKNWDADYIREMKKRRERLHFFVCEDENGKVRAIELCETRGERAEEPKIVTNIVPFIDVEDRKNREYQFMKELADWVFHFWYKKGYLKGEGIIAEQELEIISEFKGFALGDPLDFPPLGKIYRYTIDPEEYLGLK